MPIFKQPPPKVPHKPGPVVYDRTPGSMSIPKPPRPPYPGPIQTGSFAAPGGAAPVNLGAIMRYGQAQGQYPMQGNFQAPPAQAMPPRQFQAQPQPVPPQAPQNFRAVPPQAPAVPEDFQAMPTPNVPPPGAIMRGGSSFQPQRQQSFRRY